MGNEDQQQTRAIVLPPEDFARVVEAIAKPPPPNEELRRLSDRARTKVSPVVGGG